MSANQTEGVPAASGATATSSQSWLTAPGTRSTARNAPVLASTAKNRAVSPLSFCT